MEGRLRGALLGRKREDVVDECELDREDSRWKPGRGWGGDCATLLRLFWCGGRTGGLSEEVQGFFFLREGKGGRRGGGGEEEVVFFGG